MILQLQQILPSLIRALKIAAELVLKDQWEVKVFKGPQGLLGLRVPPVLKVQLVLKELRDLKEIKEIKVMSDQPVLLDLKENVAKKDQGVIRGVKAPEVTTDAKETPVLLVQPDLKVILELKVIVVLLEIQELLDQWVLKVKPER
jgi:hypothetical protein